MNNEKYQGEVSDEKKKLVKWVKDHKKQLLLAGITFGTVIAAIISVKNKKSIMIIWDSLKKSVEKKPTNVSVKISTVKTADAVHILDIEESDVTKIHTHHAVPFCVNQHVRTMAEGKHHSEKKAVEAAALGIELLPNQTLVDSYTKYAA